MLKHLFAATLSLLALGAHASVDGEKFSEDGSSADNNGFGLSYYQNSGRPVVVFYGSADENVYCLEFRESFEAEEYADAQTYDEVSDSKIDYQNVEWSYEMNNDSSAADDAWDYRIYSPGAGGGSAADGKMDSIEFVFYRQQVTLSDGSTAEALKFDINIDGYTWETDETTPMNNTFIIEFRLEDCTDEFSAERVDSSDSTDDTDGSDGGDEADSVDDPAAKRRKQQAFLAKFGRTKFIGRRRLSESDDGISSDDSHEFDLSNAFFTVARTALDENGAEVDVALSYDSGDRLHVAFDYFGASVELDPATGVLSDSSAGGVAMLVSAMVSSAAVVLLW